MCENILLHKFSQEDFHKFIKNNRLYLEREEISKWFHFQYHCRYTNHRQCSIIFKFTDSFLIVQRSKRSNDPKIQRSKDPKDPKIQRIRRSTKIQRSIKIQRSKRSNIQHEIYLFLFAKLRHAFTIFILNGLPFVLSFLYNQSLNCLLLFVCFFIMFFYLNQIELSFKIISTRLYF